MKKALLVFVSILFFSNVFSQVKLGLNINPGLLINRIQQPSGDSTFSYKGAGAGFKFTAGPDVHIMFTDNYGISLGLWYKASRVGVTTKDKITGTSFKDVYNLQYLMLPIALRMYTNEVTTGMKIYFQVGGAFDIKLASKYKKSSIINPITKFGRFDADILAGAGVEIQLGSNTALLGGIRYTRSLINNVSKVNSDMGVKKFKANGDLLSLDIGIKF